MHRMFRSHRLPRPARRSWSLPGLLLGGLLVSTAAQRVQAEQGAQAEPGRAQLLYSLQTYCSVNGTKAVPCRVDALNEGDATVYRHTIGQLERVVRITDKPTVRMELWNDGARRWQSARSASALFSLNALCFDGTSFCVVNPNYLNSVREERGESLVGRDLLEVSFGRDGRLNAYCYDDGCPQGGALQRLATSPARVAP